MKSLALVALAGFLAAAVPAGAALPALLARPLAEAGIPEDAVGLVVAPLNRVPGAPRAVEHHADRPLQPGSSMKLVTTAAALDLLGPAHRLRTRLLAAGPVRDGVLHGDLVLQGGGDPDLSWTALRALLEHARNRGLREIRGDLRLDRSAFVPARPDLGVPPFDEAPEAEYNVIPDALLVNANLLRAELFVDDRGLQIVPTPPLAGVRVTHEMTLQQGDCSEWEAGWKGAELRRPRPGSALDVVLRGTWPAGCERAVEFNLLDRNDYIGRLVRTLWSGLGGTWRGRVRDGTTPADALLLAERSSRPLSELVRAVNKPSDNAVSRLLFLAMGRSAEGRPGEPTAARAERALRGWLRRQGIADDGAVFDNGSGLSRAERLSAAQIESVLRAAATGRWAPEFLSSLPIAGIDGTMRNRLAAGPAAGQARLKTGTLRNLVALAGVVPDGGGQPCIVVLIVNHERVVPKVVRPMADALVDWVARTRLPEPGPAASAPMR